MNLPPVADRLARNRYVVDDATSHIEILPTLSAATAARLIAACPAHVYTLGPDGQLLAEYAACLECGTCFAIAPPGELTWHYPAGGYGIQYREG